jgi:tRNA G18 (ribose-2'-O)-methylase SpoU
MHEKYENQKEWIKVSLPEAVAEINRYLKERETGKIKYKKFKPKKHQKDAIDSVVNEFQKPIYGASVKGNSIFSRELPKKASYVFGSESHGISKSLSNQLTGELSIPNLREGINKAESLNVANSTAIFLSELFR